MDAKRPVFGTLSVILPLPILVLWIVMERNPDLGNGLHGYAGLFIALFLYGGTLIFCGLGFVLGISALLRRESNRFLSILGIAENIALCLWFLSHA